jgi:hypothetical protein
VKVCTRSTGSRQNPVEDNETLGFNAGREFLYQASEHQLLEEDSALGIYSTNIFHLTIR